MCIFARDNLYSTVLLGPCLQKQIRAQTLRTPIVNIVPSHDFLWANKLGKISRWKMSWFWSSKAIFDVKRMIMPPSFSYKKRTLAIFFFGVCKLEHTSCILKQSAGKNRERATCPNTRAFPLSTDMSNKSHCHNLFWWFMVTSHWLVGQH